LSGSPKSEIDAEKPVIGGGRVAFARRCSSTADGPERGLSRYRGYDLTRFVARGNDASLSEKMHRYKD